VASGTGGANRKILISAARRQQCSMEGVRPIFFEFWTQREQAQKCLCHQSIGRGAIDDKEQ
jgi:hypothetical protein